MAHTRPRSLGSPCSQQPAAQQPLHHVRSCRDSRAGSFLAVGRCVKRRPCCRDCLQALEHDPHHESDPRTQRASWTQLETPRCKTLPVRATPVSALLVLVSYLPAAGIRPAAVGISCALTRVARGCLTHTGVAAAPVYADSRRAVRVALEGSVGGLEPLLSVAD